MIPARSSATSEWMVFVARRWFACRRCQRAGDRVVVVSHARQDLPEAGREAAVSHTQEDAARVVAAAHSAFRGDILHGAAGDRADSRRSAYGFTTAIDETPDAGRRSAGIRHPTHTLADRDNAWLAMLGIGAADGDDPIALGAPTARCARSAPGAQRWLATRKRRGESARRSLRCRSTTKAPTASKFDVSCDGCHARLHRVDARGSEKSRADRSGKCDSCTLATKAWSA